MNTHTSYFSRTWVQGGMLYVFCFVILAFLLFADTGFISNDDYYHTRLATEIIEQGSLRVDFKWLPLTILNPAEYVDHHLLFHLYLAPWAYFGGVTGAKLATVSIAAGIFLAGWLLLRHSRVHHVFGWILALFATSAPFLTRMLMVRTQGAAVLLLLMALNLLFKERYRWLFVIAFAFAWLYNGYILIIAVAFFYMLAVAWMERRFRWQPLIYCLFGVAAGLVINPYFPANILFSLRHLGAKVDFSTGIRVGDEWYPYNTAEFVANSTGALILLAAGLLYMGLRGQKFDVKALTVGLVAGLTLFMSLESKRFIEYFPPFALLFAALVIGRDDLAILLPSRRLRVLGVTIVMITGLFFVVRTLSAVYDRVQSSKDHATFAGASAWLRDHAPADTLIFQTDWDDFTRLFYYNPQNVYVSGLDPTYLQLANFELWAQWEDIRRGNVKNPSEVIKDVFGANYIISDRNHHDFEDRAEDDLRLRLVYEDDYSFIWQIVEPKPVTLTDLLAEKEAK